MATLTASSQCQGSHPTVTWGVSVRLSFSVEASADAAAVAAFGEVEEDAASKPSGPEEKKPVESDGEDTRAESTNWGKGSEVPRAPRPGKSMGTLGLNL